MPTIARGNTAEIYCPIATSVTFTPGSGGAVRASFACQSGDPAIAPQFIQSATTVSVTAGATVFAEAVGADATYTESAATTVASLVSGDWNANQQAVIDAGGGLVVADDAGNLTGPGGAISGGGGGGSSTFAGLSDKTTVDIPATNTPTATALGLKAPIASPTFTGTPAAPTASLGTNTTQLATTAFVIANAGSALGPYADSSALQTAKPAASNTGRIGLVGASAPYAAYVSNGSAWAEVVTGAGSAGDPYVAVATSSTAQTIDMSAAGMVDITLTANCTLTLTGSTSGFAFSVRIVLRQDAAGSRLVTWPAGVKWGYGSAPVLSTAVNAIDEVVLTTYDGGTTYFGDLVARGRA